MGSCLVAKGNVAGGLQFLYRLADAGGLVVSVATGWDWPAAGFCGQTALPTVLGFNFAPEWQTRGWCGNYSNRGMNLNGWVVWSLSSLCVERRPAI